MRGRSAYRRARSRVLKPGRRGIAPGRDGASAGHLREALDSLPAMVGYWDGELRNRLANAAYRKFFGVTPDEIYGRHISELLGPEIFASNRGHIERVLAGEEQRFERAIPGPDGQLRHTQAIYVPDVRRGVTRGFFVLVNDITPQKRHQEALERMASHDGLTGLLNHRGLYDAIDRECSRHERFGQASTLLILDLDHFKELNDEFGHTAGDSALVEVSRLLRRRLRECDHLARQGGDEFAVVLVGAGLDEAELVGHDVCGLIASASLGRPDRPVSASIGLAGIQPGDDASTLVSRADASMYRAKREGGNRVAASAAEGSSPRAARRQPV